MNGQNKIPHSLESPYSATPTHGAQGLSCPLPSPQSGFEPSKNEVEKKANNEVNIAQYVWSPGIEKTKEDYCMGSFVVYHEE